MLSKELIELFSRNEEQIKQGIIGSNIYTYTGLTYYPNLQPYGLTQFQLVTSEGITVFNIVDFDHYQKNKEFYNSKLYKFLEGLDNDKET